MTIIMSMVIPMSWKKSELDRIDLEELLEYIIEQKLAGTLSTIKAWCKKNEIPYNLTLEDLKPYPLTCPVFQTPIDWCKKEQGPSNNSPSIDRMKPETGYVPGNVRIVSQKANRLKQNATKKELQAIVDYMD